RPRRRRAAQRSASATDDSKQRPAATLLLCVPLRLPHPIFRQRRELAPHYLALLRKEDRVPPHGEPAVRPHRAAPDRGSLAPADRLPWDWRARVLSRALVRLFLRRTSTR